MEKPLKELYDDLRVAHSMQAGRGGSGAVDESFVLRLSHLLLSYGVAAKASDIHIEPTVEGAQIRYRVDGILHQMIQVPPETRDALIRSIKLKASMTTEPAGRSRPQDGRIDFEVNGRALDLRLSSFPTLFGDVLAIRVLDRSRGVLPLEQIGLPPELLATLTSLARRPNGLLLVTGPAGSGKTTTLYAALDLLRSPDIKIVTLEDPVECQMEGVDQAQINPGVGLTFASGLRAVLRQDANIILVGEIRDQETADIAIRAALTGHLVLSTMHTRNSLGAATRLIEMGIEPYLILASVSGVVAQRLVRVICPHCRAPDPAAEPAFVSLWKQETSAAPPETALASLTRGAGCAACNRTGYHGRVGIFELLILTDELKQLILERASGQLYRSVKATRALETMLLNGLEKAAQGLTTVAEVLRVIGETEEA